ncbi:hypothetical protein GCM10010195_55570 [Kitasatospora griseola]|nr:hypothetical protein GCM10010195_55570 [Kitasatospora griseola]
MDRLVLQHELVAGVDRQLARLDAQSARDRGRRLHPGLAVRVPTPVRHGGSGERVDRPGAPHRTPLHRLAQIRPRTRPALQQAFGDEDFLRPLEHVGAHAVAHGQLRTGRQPLADRPLAVRHPAAQVVRDAEVRRVL